MRLLITILFMMFMLLSQSQQWNSSRILHEIQKVKYLGNVLYLAAHPDDENTRFISYCANEKKNAHRLSVSHKRRWRSKPYWH